jgi:hypothetical protein
MHACLCLTHATSPVCWLVLQVTNEAVIDGNEKPEGTGESNGYAFEQVRELLGGWLQQSQGQSDPYQSCLHGQPHPVTCR